MKRTENRSLPTSYEQNEGKRLRDLAQVDPRSASAELRVLRKAVQRAIDEVRDAKTSVRRMQKELARERSRAADAERSLEEWRQKHKQITSSFIWRIYSLLELYRARSLLRGRQSPAPDLHDASRRKLNDALRPLGDNGNLVNEAKDESKSRDSGGQFSRDAFSSATYQIPDLGSLSARTPRGRIAVVLHLYYPELWPEFRDAIGSIPEPADLFVTLTAGYSNEAADWIRVDYPEAQIIILENRGRDILPFVVLINSGVLFKYELVCKLHTKRSLYRGKGDGWRRDLIAGVLSKPDHVARILAAFDSNPQLGIVVADGSLHASRPGRVNELCKQIGMPAIADSGRIEFPRGSIFWIRASLLQPIAKLMLKPADFEPEPLRLSGTLPHAIERFIGHLCREARMHVLESGDFED
jgi:hypothetical protein